MQPFHVLLAESAAAHGHLCPGQVVGVRMALLGCRLIGLDEPRSREQIKKLIVYVEMDRCTADAVAQWLALARTNARAVPVESRLTRSTAATPANAGPATLGNTGAAPVPRWDGTVVLALPAR